MRELVEDPGPKEDLNGGKVVVETICRAFAVGVEWLPIGRVEDVA